MRVHLGPRRAAGLAAAVFLAAGTLSASALKTAGRSKAAPKPVPKAAGAWVAPKSSPLWLLGGADARLIQAGWGYDARAQAWVPQVELRFVDRDLKRPFRKAVRVEFIPAAGRPWVWRTFVALAPGTAQHRRIRADARLGFHGPLDACPALGLRVDLRPRDPRDMVQPLPRAALTDPEAPPAGVPLYVAAVEAGGVLRLLDGRRVEPLGVACAPGAQARAAASWVRARVMDAPITLAYDSVPPDRGGRWRAYIRLPDGGDLGKDLLRRGLAGLDAREPFGREAAYRSLAARTSSSRRASR